jgi:hypothetical protein
VTDVPRDPKGVKETLPADAEDVVEATPAAEEYSPRRFLAYQDRLSGVAGPLLTSQTKMGPPEPAAARHRPSGLKATV